MLWTKVKNKIFETERPILKGLKRHVNMTLNPTDNYLTKLDLIDTHPQLFIKENKNKFSESEIEQLRIQMTEGQQLFASRSPRKLTPVIKKPADHHHMKKKKNLSNRGRSNTV